MTKKVRVVYFSGPGDIVNTFRLWCKGIDDPHQQAITYSGQFYTACKNKNVELLAISKSPKDDSYTHENICAKNKTTLWDREKGIRFFLGYFIRGLYILTTCIKEKTDVVFVADGNTFWFMLLPLRLFNIEVVPTLHCTFWPQTKKRSPSNKIILSLSRPLFKRTAKACLAVSADISGQIRSIRQTPSGDMPPIIEFIPSYKVESSQYSANSISRKPFHLLFVSRIEKNKGIYNLIDIAKKINNSKLSIIIDVAGEGSDLKELETRIHEEDLSHIIKLHGYCFKEQMKKLVEKSHAFIVTTTEDFIEGFNKVCAESILASRPLIVSSVCPAKSYIKDAAIEVEPNDVDGYFNAIVSLSTNSALYNKMCTRTQELHDIFLSNDYSFESGVSTIIQSLIDETPIRERTYTL